MFDERPICTHCETQHGSPRSHNRGPILCAFCYAGARLKPPEEQIEIQRAMFFLANELASRLDAIY